MELDYIDRIAFIDIKDTKVLLTLSKNKDTWFIPGGKREKGETDIEALIREAKEELTVDIIPDSISYFTTLEGKAYGKSDGTNVRIKYYTGEFTGTLKPNAEIHKVEYFSFKELPKLAETGKIIVNVLKAKGLIK